jgi:hypothetical protein
MVKILIFGEGPNDVGRREWNRRTGDHTTEEGWLQPIVRRLRSTPGSETAERLRVLVSLPVRGAPRPLSGLSLKAQIAKFRAATEGYTAVVVATDVDSADPRDHARKVEEIEAGFDAFPGEVAGVACVPMGTSEAWLLADEDAWRALGARNLREIPRRPEETWGRPHDPDSGHPKCVFHRLCADNDVVDDTATRAILAETCDLGRINAACPIGFRPFAAAMASTT